MYGARSFKTKDGIVVTISIDDIIDNVTVAIVNVETKDKTFRSIIRKEKLILLWSVRMSDIEFESAIHNAVISNIKRARDYSINITKYNAMLKRVNGRFHRTDDFSRG